MVEIMACIAALFLLMCGVLYYVSGKDEASRSPKAVAERERPLF